MNATKSVQRAVSRIGGQDFRLVLRGMLPCIRILDISPSPSIHCTGLMALSPLWTEVFSSLNTTYSVGAPGNV